MIEIADAQKRLKRCMEHWKPIYDKSIADIEFLSDEDGAQWERDDYNQRRTDKRPRLTIDQLTQFVNQVTNEIRMNTPVINVTPEGGTAKKIIADVFKGLIRQIERKSRADIAYDTAASFAIEGSIGYFRIDHDYEGERGFDQELQIRRVINPHMVFLDEGGIEPDGSDNKIGFVVDMKSIEAFKQRWPGKDAISFECETLPPLPDEEHVYVVECFKIEESDGTLYMLRDGGMGELDGELDPETAQDVVAHRPYKRRIVRRYWLSGAGVLEETTFPGRYVPIIPVMGKEAWLNGKRNLHSLIRKSKDAQRMFNYWATIEAELLMRQPKAQVIAARGTVEDYMDLYMDPNGPHILPFEPYDEQDRPLPPPQFGNPPAIPAGVVNARRESVSDIRSTLGLYEATLGQRSNEVSGTAINARKMQGDRATYHFGDNLIRSIEHAGRILVGAIPVIYDTPREVSVVGLEDEVDVIGINGHRVEGQEVDIILSEGQYEANVTTSAPFATLREEAAEFFKQVVMTSPELMGVMGDLVFKYMDFPGSQVVAERLRRTIPPDILGESGDNPELQAAMQQLQELQAGLAQSQQETAQLHQQLKSRHEETVVKAQTELAKNDTELMKQQVERERLRLEEKKIESEHMLALAETALKESELELQEDELELRERELASARKETAHNTDAG